MSDHMILAAVINWNGWRDTVACAQSLFAVPGPRFQLLICDNGSTDGSFESLAHWLRSGASPITESHASQGADMQILSFEGNFGVRGGALRTIHLMGLKKNYGYAGAINRCIAWGKDVLAAKGFWLLNNDVKVNPQALAHLADAAKSSPDIGLCGSVLLDWEDSGRIQAIGGMFQRYLAVGWHLKKLPTGIDPRQELFFGIDYPVGASLFVTCDFIESVGMMDDGYFLYYEEIDWSQRGRSRGFRPAVALRSKVQHKEGASTGSGGGVRSKSMLSEYYGVVSRLRFTKKFSPFLLPIVWLSLSLVMMDRMVHGEWARALLIVKLMLYPRSVARP